MGDEPFALTPWHRPTPRGIQEGLIIHDGLLAATGAKSGARVVGSGQVVFDLGSEDGLIFDLNTGGIEILDAIKSGDYQFTLEKLPDDGQQHRGISMSRVDVRDDSSWGDPSDLHEVRFYAINGSTYGGAEMVRATDGSPFPGRTTLKGGGWIITLDLRDDLPNRADRLWRSGYLITHCASLRRSRGGMFSWKQAEPVLATFHDFLSFARGARVGTALPTGLDAEGIVKFEAITNTTADRGCDHSGWWPNDHPDVIVTAWPAFLELHSTPFGQQVLERVLSAYTDSIEGPPRRGVVTAVMGLETLTWAVLVERESWLTPEAFTSARGLQAKDKLGLMLKWAGMSHDLPECGGALDDLKRATNSLEPRGPAAVTWVRNSVVHPHDQKGADRVSEVHHVQAWMLSLWYLELLTLRLLGFGGLYHNRLTGDVEPVPWA